MNIAMMNTVNESLTPEMVMSHKSYNWYFVNRAKNSLNIDVPTIDERTVKAAADFVVKMLIHKYHISMGYSEYDGLVIYLKSECLPSYEVSFKGPYGNNKPDGFMFGMTLHEPKSYPAVTGGKVDLGYIFELNSVEDMAKYISLRIADHLALCFNLLNKMSGDVLAVSNRLKSDIGEPYKNLRIN